MKTYLGRWNQAVQQEANKIFDRELRGLYDVLEFVVEDISNFEIRDLLEKGYEDQFEKYKELINCKPRTMKMELQIEARVQVLYTLDLQIEEF